MNLRPTASNLLIRRAAPDDKTPGGLYIPDKAKNKPHRGVVVAAGRGYVNDHGVFIENEIKEGDVVLFGAALGIEIQVNGEQLLIVDADGVMAVVEG